MSTIKREITKEEYDRMSKLTYGELTREVESGLSDSIRWGYGYYGCRLVMDAGKYFIDISIGSSCD